MATQTHIEADLTTADMENVVDFQQLTVRMFGKEIPQPRLVAWYGPRSYTYSGLTLPAAEMPAGLRELCARVSEIAGEEFNAVMCNLYGDGSDSVSWHSDDEPEFGGDPVIASLTIGATRRFLLRNKATGEKQTFDLGDGSVLVMEEGTQATHEHSVPKTKKPVGQRINLTFRRCV